MGKLSSEKAAYSYLIYNGIGSAILLIVFSVLFAKTGTTNITELKEILTSVGAGEEWLSQVAYSSACFLP